jgi:hypothetical protein
MNSELSSTTAVLAVIDWQERLFPAMPEGLRDRALAQGANLTWLARSLDIPIVASEQYPRGLGPTLPDLEISQALPKTTFSAMRDPAFRQALEASGRSQVILSGMETHICVAQTARDLLASALEVWVVADACLSRRRLDWELGLDRMRADGARVVTAEAALFELLGEAAGPIFKELSRRIR